VPLVITVTLVQAVLALMSCSLPLFGMPLTAATGMPPEAEGQLSSATSFGSMVFYLWGSALLIRLTSIRQLQIGCATSAVAMLFCIAGHWEGMLLAAFVIGLAYDPTAPAGSDLLMRVWKGERTAFSDTDQFMMQALNWPGATSLRSGTTFAHSATAWGQRVRKTQPDGGLIGLGMSPARRTLLRLCPGLGTGTADKSAFV